MIESKDRVAEFLEPYDLDALPPKSAKAIRNPPGIRNRSEPSIAAECARVGTDPGWRRRPKLHFQAGVTPLPGREAQVEDSATSRPHRGAAGNPSPTDEGFTRAEARNHRHRAENRCSNALKRFGTMEFTGSSQTSVIEPF